MQKDAVEQSESSGDWNLVPESMLNTMVNVHNQLFGSNNLIESVCPCTLFQFWYMLTINFTTLLLMEFDITRSWLPLTIIKFSVFAY